MPTVQRASTPRCSFQAATLKRAARAESRRRAPHGRGGARSLQCAAPAVGRGHGGSMTSQAALDAALPQVNRSGRGCGPLPWAWSGGWAAAGGWNRTWRTQPCGWRERAQYLVSTCELRAVLASVSRSAGCRCLGLKPPGAPQLFLCGTWLGRVQAQTHPDALQVVVGGVGGTVCSVLIAVLENRVQEGLKDYSSPISKIPALSCNGFLFFRAASGVL